MAAWEMYVCPPLTDDVLTGDILRCRYGDRSDAAQFRLVLSPSCDMARHQGGPPKVARILVARCAAIDRARSEVLEMSPGKLRERLPKVLNQGYFDGMLPLPELPESLPTMMADFKDLELVAFEDLDTETGKFVRVASVDSPFRELVAWAYGRIATRPGLPDRDTTAWAAEIITASQPRKV